MNSRLEDLNAAAQVLKGKKIAARRAVLRERRQQVGTGRSRKARYLADSLGRRSEPLPAGCGPCIGLGVGLLEKGEVGISATNRNFKGRMGSRDAQCYLASPEVVAASAVAGYIRGPHEFADRNPARHYNEFVGHRGSHRKS